MTTETKKLTDARSNDRFLEGAAQVAATEKYPRPYICPVQILRKIGGKVGLSVSCRPTYVAAHKQMGIRTVEYETAELAARVAFSIIQAKIAQALP